MLWYYALKSFVEQLNYLKLNGDRVTPMEKFSGTTTDITLKNHHIWGYKVYVLDAGLQGHLAELTK